MIRVLSWLIIGIAILAGSIVWYLNVQFSMAGLVSGITMGIGGACIVAAFATALDIYSPTSRKV
ncbi:hypothetical protein [Corynebacterium sp. MNWGS58]|uniref:hypothetical protein n=1 Tax=Corynebacterium sp. 102791.4 TaxID=3104612 RepID=UPI00351934A8